MEEEGGRRTIYVRSITDPLNIVNEVFRSAGPGGVSIFRHGHCTVMPCQNKAVPGMQACPLHYIPPGLSLKAGAGACANCDAAFDLNFLRRHHCRCCGRVFCVHCVDYRLNSGVKAPLYKRQWFETPRVCVACAARLHPSLVRRHIITTRGSRLVRFDALIVCDGTASMGPYIRSVERNFMGVIDDLEAHHADGRFGCVIYRDHVYGADAATVLRPQKHHHRPVPEGFAFRN